MEQYQHTSTDITHLSDKLNQEWQNYLLANEDTDAKQNYLELFLYNFQFVDFKLLHNEEFKSFLNPIPEEICSYLLELVYEIISKSDLSTTALVSVNATNPTKVKHENNKIAINKANLKALRKHHNFSQLVLKTPSDCNKIIALRTFLTDQVGQHLLEFLLQVDSKLIASQKSLCNLCINLFPNCTWTQTYRALDKSISIAEIFSDFTFYQHRTKSKTVNKSKESLRYAAASTSTLTSSTSTPSISSNYTADFDSFKSMKKTSDEIALMLIKLLKKCIIQESETLLTEQSMTILALNFALNCLQSNSDNINYSSTANAEIIKNELLHLIQLCFNNLFANDDNPNAVQFPIIFAKLTEALANNDTYIDISFALIFFILSTLYNLIVVYSSTRRYGKKIVGNEKLIDKDVVVVCMQRLQQLPQLSTASALFAHIFKTLLRITDLLARYESTMNISDVQHRLHMRKKNNLRHMHCRQLPKDRQHRKQQQQHPDLELQLEQDKSEETLCCFFQSNLLQLLPTLQIELQEYTMRYLLRSGICCCHYTLATYGSILQVASGIAANYQKCAYKFLQRFILSGIFLRSPNTGLRKGHETTCLSCDDKLKSHEFQAGLLKHYKHIAEQLLKLNDPVALELFLKHLKRISHLLPYDIASGVVAEIVLPIFRLWKSKTLTTATAAATATALNTTTSSLANVTASVVKNFWLNRTKSNSNESTPLQTPLKPPKPLTLPTAPSTPTTSKATTPTTTPPKLFLNIHSRANEQTDALTLAAQQAHVLRTLNECLNIFAMYLCDIRLVKAFYNEENIKHLEDLLNEPELIRGICDLIKIGIDNITFLGDNSQEQLALSRRLITLQLNSSDRAAQLFTDLIQRLEKCLPNDRFWFDGNDKSSFSSTSTTNNLDTLHILHTTALQWSLNYDLLKTSQLFYNEFAKTYSIVVEDDLDGDDAPSQTETAASLNFLKHGDKTIIDILRLNYNALCCFLLLPLHTTMPVPLTAAQRNQNAAAGGGIAAANIKRHQQQKQQFNTFSTDCQSVFSHSFAKDNAIDCLSSSLEAQFSSLSYATANTITTPLTTAIAITSANNTIPYHRQTATQVAALAYDSTANYAKITEFYEDISNSGNTFLQQLSLQQSTSSAISSSTTTSSSSKLLLTGDESIVLFDIRNQANHSSGKLNSYTTPNSITNYNTATSVDTLLSSDTEKQSGVGDTHASSGVIENIYHIFGWFFGGSRTQSFNDLSERQQPQKIDEQLACLFQVNGDCKKLLLKFFEATMAICIKGYQNEEVEKMQKHLRKLKAVILNSASDNWQQYGTEQTRDNSIVQTLQTLLKIAELSSSLNEPAGVVSSSILTTATDDEHMSLPLRTRAMARCSQLAIPAVLPAKNAVATPPTPCRPLSGESADADYFSTRASIICPDSDLEFSDNNDDFYLTADEGYEADGEVPDATETDNEGIDAVDIWNSFQPTSRYRTHVLHDGLCRLVIEVLIELSKMCLHNPKGWCESLTQLANRLFIIRDYLGGPLFLLRGFQPVLECNDVRLKELQQSLLELISDLNTPDVLTTFFSILGAKQAPVDILIKYMHFICTNTLKKPQPYIELEFPVIIDGKCISTGDVAMTEQIDRMRNYHLHCQANTPFTRAPLFLPITHARLWHNDGLTASLWFNVKSTQTQRTASQLIEDDARSSSDDYLKTHIVSLGTNQAMLSVYINNNMNLVFETCKPNVEVQTRNLSNEAAHSSTMISSESKKQQQQQPSATTTTVTHGPQNISADTSSPISPLRNALKQTKLVFLHGFSHMHLFNGHTAECETHFDISCADLKHCRLSKNRWTHLSFAVDCLPDRLDIIVYIDGLERHVINLPFRNFRNLTRTHVFQMIALGDGASSKSLNNTASCTESRSTIDSQPMRLSISNFMLFNRKITMRDCMLNLAAMGPDFIEFTQCQVANWKPNYGYCNLSRIFNGNFGNHYESMRLLKQVRILTYSAQQPDIILGYDTNLEFDSASYGKPYGLILYGELIQNQLPSLQTATILCGGLSALIYLFARVVETSVSSAAQAMALDMFLRVALSESQLYTEFQRNDYISLIGYVIKSERCTKDVNLLKSIINNACTHPIISRKADCLQVSDNTIASVVYPRLITSILHRYSDWHRSGVEHSDVLDMLFQCIIALTREKHPHRDFNMDQLNNAGLLRELLNICKVYVIESPNPVYISKTAAISFVQILSIFAGSPPTPSLMDEVMKLLLLLHRPSECYITHDLSKFYFLLTPQVPTKEKTLSAVNLSRVAAPFRRSLMGKRPGVAIPTPTPTTTTTTATEKINNQIDLDAERHARILRLRRLHTNNASYKQPVHELEENLENIADCTKLNKNALRLLSPVEASRWRAKYKRHHNTPSPKSKHTVKLMPKTTTSPLSSSAKTTTTMQSKITRKRLRMNSSNSLRQVTNEKRLRSERHSKSSTNSISLSNFENADNYDELTSILNDVFSSTPIQRRTRSLVKTDFYKVEGIIVLQEGLLLLLKDFLCLLPDNTVDEVLKHYVKVEFLLVLANHSNCAVRTAIIKLLAALTIRLPQNELLASFKSLYPQHLANQLSMHATDEHILAACVAWLSGAYGNLETFLHMESLQIEQRFALNAFLATLTKATAQPNDFATLGFRVLHKLYKMNLDEQQLLMEAGLLQCCVKALYNLYAQTGGYNTKTEDIIVELLTTIAEKSLKSVGHIHIVWEILNMLSFYQSKYPLNVVKCFRSVQGLVQLNCINMFFVKTNVPWQFKVATPANCTLTHAELKTRLDLLVDRCTQFFTVFCGNYAPSLNEIKLFELLVSYCIATNQRCNNFIAWGLQPSRPRDLRAFIVDALWISCQDDFLPAIICDGKMIKSLLWLCLLEDLDEPIKNLQFLCKHLGITENDSTWNLENELERIELYRCTITAKQKTLLEKTVYKLEALAQNCIESSMVTTRRVVELQNAERKLIMSHMKDYDDTYTYTQWVEIIRRMSHEGAPWFNQQHAETSWELDDTEGPSRVHTRLRRCHLEIDKRFFMEDYAKDSTNAAQTNSNTETASTVPGTPAASAKTMNNNSNNTNNNNNTQEYTRPLEYLISSYDQQLNISLNSQILYNFPAKYLPVDGEIDGEIIITDHKLYFLATYRCKYFNVNCDITNIAEIWLKRYQHQEKAFEIFLDTNQSLFFSLHNQDDWKIMRDVFCDKIITTPDPSKIMLITQQWRDGLLTNWEYLMTLNQIAGRTYNDLMQYPVFPWILSDYTTKMIDLTDASVYRKLEKPIAVQNPDNEQHYINNYTYINSTATNMGSLILKPYHYSSHYSNSGTVLHFLVRVPPFTSYFLRYQDNNFDLPDRTFHALSTTWSLASRDSPTDVKELIPEFFCLPEMFENFERFNFGCRQSGERVEDVLLPPWCLRDARLFVLIHRQALESELVRNNLHNWIDLIFGYKQTGESAVEAINVFHPATYAVFLESEINDPIERKAVETMVKTYGQMPRQLFKYPHTATKLLNYCLTEDKPVVSSVRGLRWGVYVGSPQLPPPILGNLHKLPGAEYLVSFSNTNVVYGLPAKSAIMQGAEADTYNVISWGYDDRIVSIQPLNKLQAKPKNLLKSTAFDDITACGCDSNSNQLWFGHKSGRISVYKCTGIAGDASNRIAKGRQSYVRGLRLSYNSAFRKMTSKTSSKLDGDADSEHQATSAMPTLSTTTTNASAGGAHNMDTAQRDSADLSWLGPTVLIRHTDEITCITLSLEYKIAVTAGRDGIAVIWDLNNWSYVRTIESPPEIHHSPITLIAISPTLGDIVTVHAIVQHSRSQTASADDIDATQQADNARSSSPTPSVHVADECFEVTEENLDDFVNVAINPNGKSILRLHTVNARYVQRMIREERILAVCYSYVKEGVGVNVIATAIEGGIVRLWSSWNLSFVSEIVTGLSNIKSITYSTHQHLVVLTKESHIQVWETDGLYGNSPKFPQIAYK